MQTREIPRDEWGSFLNGFSRRHERWRITVDVLSPDLGAQTEVKQVPLLGISAAAKCGENKISIMTANGPGAHTTHFIEEPRRLWLEQSEEGADRSIEIESANGIKTIVRFRDTVESPIPAWSPR